MTTTRRNAIPALSDERIACLSSGAGMYAVGPSREEVRAMAVELQVLRALSKTVSPVPTPWDKHERCEDCGEGHMANCSKHESAPMKGLHPGDTYARTKPEFVGNIYPRDVTNFYIDKPWDKHEEAPTKGFSFDWDTVDGKAEYDEETGEWRLNGIVQGKMSSRLARQILAKMVAPEVGSPVQLAKMGGRNERLPITHVALRFQDKIWSLPKPYRHHHLIDIIHYLNPSVGTITSMGEDQGFLDEAGRYLTRKQALINAQLHAQIKNGKLIGNCLTSEDLW